MNLASTAFDAGQEIPRRYTCDGDDVSPPLEWSELPAGTRSLTLVVDDPDAPRGLWTHWVVYGLAPTRGSIDEGVVPGGTRQGENSWGNARWQGPCPPGGTHRYRFRLLALDRELDLPAGASREQVAAAMEGHVLAETVLRASYGRAG